MKVELLKDHSELKAPCGSCWVVPAGTVMNAKAIEMGWVEVTTATGRKIFLEPGMFKVLEDK